MSSRTRPRLSKLREHVARARAAGWIGSVSLGHRLSLLATVLIAGSVGTLEDFGIIGAATGTVVVVTQSLGYSSGVFATSLAGRLGATPARRYARGLYLANAVGGFAFSLALLVLLTGLPLTTGLPFALFAGLNCLLQCETGILTGCGAHRAAASATLAPFTLGIALTLPFASLSPSIGVALALCAGHVGAILALRRPLRELDELVPVDSSSEPLPPITKSVLAIAGSGIALSGAAYGILWKVNTIGGTIETAFFTIGAQWRSALFFVPGALGAYATAQLARISSNDRHSLARATKGAALTSSFAMTALLIGGLALFSLVALGGRLRPEVTPVLLFASASGFAIAVSSPYLRLLARLRGEVPSMMVSTVSAAFMIGASVLLAPSAASQTLAMSIGYVAQALLAIALASRATRA